MKPGFQFVAVGLFSALAGFAIAFALLKQGDRNPTEPESPAPPEKTVAQPNTPPTDQPNPKSLLTTPPKSESPGEPTTNKVDPEFADLMERVFSNEATEDEQIRFWEKARTGRQLSAVIKQLEGEVAREGEDVDRRMNLADAYLAKLLGVPDGPEKGLWAGKAMEVWKEVVELDPDQWKAQRSIAMSLSQYPDFLNKTGAAIEAYEKTLNIQSRAEPRGEFALTYLELSRLHRKNGDPASALQVLEEGVAAFPDNGDLGKQLETMQSSYVFEEEK
ncbi:MAG: hypothetical protein AAF514_15170 [Verrucomicrobiota bacterium]